MKKLPIALVAIAFACAMNAAPAQAQVARTFLSAAGSDSNNCANVMTPCRHMANAFAATSNAGEIYVLDPANYGSLTITHAVSIEGHGWASIAAPGSGQTAITIEAGPNDQVFLHGMTLEGSLTGGDGISFASGQALYVDDSVIQNFTGAGIIFRPQTFGSLVVSNTRLLHNGIGINIQGDVGDVIAALNRVETNGNAGNGINYVALKVSTVKITVAGSISSNNAGAGVACQSAVAATVTNPFSILISNSTITNNGGAGISAVINCTVLANRSTFIWNSPNFSAATDASIFSSGDNDTDNDGTIANSSWNSGGAGRQ